MRENSIIAMEPLQALEEELRRLVERSHPLTLVIGDLDAALPQYPLDMLALRALLLHPSVGYQVRGAVWARLLALTASPGRRGEDWPTAVCAMALPGLRRIAGRVRREAPELVQVEVQQAMLAGFWEAAVELRGRLERVDAGRIPASLCWSADRAARAYRAGELRHTLVRADLGEQPEQCDGMPAGSPDQVLERAVERDVLSREQAELIASTRLGGTSVRALAEAAGISAEAMGMRRHRAELRLAKALHAGLLEE